MMFANGFAVATCLVATPPGAFASGPDYEKAGSPLPGLTAEQLARFELGKQRYQTPLQEAEGLGPIFNKSSCATCHTNPVGGWGSITVKNFGLADKGSFDPLTQFGGPLLQVSSLSEGCAEEVYVGANTIILRLTNSSMAFGMIEAIPDAAIAANADPLDLDGDLVSGRARTVQSVEAPGVPRIGRFGWKAQVATVLSFSADAAVNEMGLTNRFFQEENAPNGDAAVLAQCDSVADPEDGPDAEGLDFLDRVTDFQRFLSPPPQTPKSGMSGEAIFNAIGCAKCHVAQWTTADARGLEDALRNKTIRPYSDFLLHDMGLLGDGFVDGDAEALEMRTPTLWNLRSRDPMLHDGRAAGGSFFDRVAGNGGAIWWHNVVASEARDIGAAFFALPPSEQAKLVAFLDSLGRLAFDADGSNAIDLFDFDAFMGCFGDVGVNADAPCAIHDADQDGDVDLNDFAVFLSRYQPSNRDCDDDGTSDLLEVLLGATDKNHDGIPDSCTACAADLNASGGVDAADLGIALGAWGTAGADINGDGTTNAVDLGIVLGSWGPCPTT